MTMFASRPRNVRARICGPAAETRHALAPDMFQEWPRRKTALPLHKGQDSFHERKEKNRWNVAMQRSRPPHEGGSNLRRARLLRELSVQDNVRRQQWDDLPAPHAASVPDTA
eukprot:3069045-Rhodomonas_salina.2